MSRFILVLLLLFSIGCDERQFVLVEPPEPEVPVANLPVGLRQKNWTSKQQNKYGQGSCVHASTVMMFRWHNQEKLAEFWRKKYSGGETSVSITKYLRENGIPYASTLNEDTYECSGDPEFLKKCSETRRAAILWWKTAHCCLFVGFSEINGKTVACVIDNNYPGEIEYHEVNDFIRKWRGFGGFACTIVSPKMQPASPIPFPVVVPKRNKETEGLWN